MEIIAKLVTIIFSNEANNYKVIIVKDKEQKTYTLTGYIPSINEDLYYIYDVNEVMNKRYGLQYVVNSFKIHNEKNADSIINYLTSSLFKGIGLISAEAIYDTLGDDALELIYHNPSVLNDVPKLSEKQKLIIYNQIVANKIYEDIFLELNKLEISNQLSLKIYEKYGDKTLDILHKNPYVLIYDFENVGFLKADKLALNLGFSFNDLERLKAALVYSFNNLINRYGMTYLTETQLLRSTYNFLETNHTAPEKRELVLALSEAIKDDKFIIEDNKIYLPFLYYDEINIAKKLNLLNELKEKKINKKTFDSLIKDFEFINSIKLEDTQIEAIYNALKHNVSIITGGPGTGKTTIIKAIITLYSALNGFNLYDDEANFKILLAAPTGKASKRINEQTLFKAQTIHKSLGYNFDHEYQYDENNNLPHDLIIIDEASMVDNNLASHLLKALKNTAKIVFVGDVFQLPSISPGAFLKDIIESGSYNVTYLKTIFRQLKNSHIIALSDMVKEGKIEYEQIDFPDLKYLPCSIEETPYLVTNIIEEEIDKGRDLYNDIEALIPMYRGLSGIDNINMEISKKFNKDYSYSVKRGDIEFHENDKIMCLVNSSDWRLMNGDLGILGEKKLFLKDDKTKEGYLAIFDEQNINITDSDFESFNLAYATSVHKGQGAEYKVVILVLNQTFKPLLKRKLLYTAISRAKECLYIVGDIRALNYGISVIEDERQTSLKARLLTKFRRKVIINDPEIPFDFLGEEKDEAIDPYYFMENNQ